METRNEGGGRKEEEGWDGRRKRAGRRMGGRGPGYRELGAGEWAKGNSRRGGIRGRMSEGLGRMAKGRGRRGWGRGWERREEERGGISHGEGKGEVLEEETGRRACRRYSLAGGVLDGDG